MRALSKTFFGVDATREKVEFDTHETFLGANLQEELGRVVTTAGVTVRQQLTPLTSVTFEASDEQDRFDLRRCAIPTRERCPQAFPSIRLR